MALRQKGTLLVKNAFFDRIAAFLAWPLLETARFKKSSSPVYNCFSIVFIPTILYLARQALTSYSANAPISAHSQFKIVNFL